MPHPVSLNKSMNRNITATILIVLAAGIYFTVTEGVINDAKAVQAVNNRYTSALNSAAELIKVRDQVQASYNNISQIDRDRLSKMLPGNVDNIRLAIDLNGIAMKHGITLSGVSASAASAKSPRPSIDSSGSNLNAPTLDTVDVSFGVSAPYLEFISFMQDLEANLRVMDIVGFGMTSSDNGVYGFNVKIKTYWLRQ